MDPRTGYFKDSYLPPSLKNMDNEDATSTSGYSSSSNGSTSDSNDSYDSELLELQAAEQEWEENMRQLQLAVSVLILPTLGKWLGRRWSYWREWCTFGLFDCHD
jgi:peptidoglycan hydrolase-like amidase